MSPTLLKKRGFLAIESFAGRLAGYQLAFTLMGYEGCEPRFANLMRHDPTNPSGMQVHGVAHRLTRDDLERLDEFEGSGFKRIEALFEPYGSNGGEAFPVFAYVALPVKLASPALPSRRYRDLLVRLASENGLSEAYHDWLRSQSCLDTDDVRMPVPTPEEAQRRFGPQELAACSYKTFSPQATPGGVARAVLVTMGGQVFDLGAHTVARTPGPSEPMLRNMALMQDGTAFVLDILSRAYPEQGGVGGGDGGSSLASLNGMQRGYVAAWTQFLVSNACPRVGVLDGYEILLEPGYTPPLHSTTPGPTTPSTPSVLLEEEGGDVDEIAADWFGVALATRLKGLGIVNG